MQVHFNNWNNIPLYFQTNSVLVQEVLLHNIFNAFCFVSNVKNICFSSWIVIISKCKWIVLNIVIYKLDYCDQSDMKKKLVIKYLGWFYRMSNFRLLMVTLSNILNYHLFPVDPLNHQHTYTLQWRLNQSIYPSLMF